jgi:hypothetical protein
MYFRPQKQKTPRSPRRSMGTARVTSILVGFLSLFPHYSTFPVLPVISIDRSGSPLHSLQDLGFARHCRHSFFPLRVRKTSTGLGHLRAAFDTANDPLGKQDASDYVVKETHLLPPLTYKINKRSKYHGRPQFKEPVVIPAMEEHTATIIFLHGFGSDGPGRGKDLPELLNLPWVKYLVPLAPARKPFLQIGQALQSWATIDPITSFTHQVQTIAGTAGKLISGETQVCRQARILQAARPLADSSQSSFLRTDCQAGDPAPPRNGRS